MRRLVLAVCVVAAAGCECSEAPASEGEGDEGEGDVGEGEGDVGEGEGDVGEGEGDVGEGEGDVGEGEGDVGEGEGDVAEGEGEGDVVDDGVCTVGFGAGDACGGVLDGTFSLSAHCEPDPPVIPAVVSACPAAVFGAATFSGTATLTFAAGTLRSTSDAQVVVGFSLPSSCRTEACFTLGADFGATCVEGVGANLGGCDCVGVGDFVDAGEDVVDVDSAGGTFTFLGHSHRYCVTAQGLEVRSTNAAELAPTGLYVAQ